MAVTTPASTPVVESRTTTDIGESKSKARYAWGITRIMLGWTFLWAFLDKTFALGFSTGRNPETGAIDYLGEAAWVSGGSPTFGFLNFGTAGPFAEAYQSIAGAAWADWLFMLGLLGVGLALALGIGMRVAAVAGTALLVMMWSAVLPPATNPFMTYHLIWAVTIIGLALAGAGRTFGLGKVWERTSLVQKFPFLK